MYLLRFSLDNLSLMALTIAVGFMIDDAVIIIENVIRLIESGETPIEAALKGTRQVGFTVISVTIALIAALIPILFMPDIVGRLFREFGLTLVIAILTSAVVSLTLTPMLCGQLLVRSGTRPAGRVSRACRFIVERAGELYGKSLEGVLRFRWLTLAFAALLTAASVGLYLYILKGFLPTQDTSLLRIRTVGKSNISFDAMSEAQQAVGAVIGADPAVAHLASFIGRGLMSSGTMLVSLKPPGERNEPIEQVISRIRKKLLRIDGVKTFITPVQDVSVWRAPDGGALSVQFAGARSAALFKWARIMRQKIENLPQVNDVMWNYEGAGLETGLLVNRARAARPGISVVDIDEILYDWLASGRSTPSGFRSIIPGWSWRSSRVSRGFDRPLQCAADPGRPCGSDERTQAPSCRDVDQPRQPAPGHHHRIQHSARRLDRAGGGSYPRRRDRSQPAGRDQGELQG